MSCISIYRDNFIDIDILANDFVSSEDPNFPLTNAFNRQRRSKVWRSEGFYRIESGSNTIVFRETIATPLTATISPGEYTSTASFVIAIEAAFESAGFSDYTVTHTNNLKFNIASDGSGGGGILELIWTDGASSAMASILGYDTSIDRTGSLSYEADDLIINTEEFVTFDLGITANITHFAMIGPRNRPLKYSTNATLKLEANETNNFTSPSFSKTLSLLDNVIHYEDEAGIGNDKYRYWRISFNDQNPKGFVEIGSFFLGNVYKPTTGSPQFPFVQKQLDRSITAISEGGQTFTDEREKTQQVDLEWKFLTKEEKEEFEFIVEDRFGNSRPFFISIDPNNNFSTDERMIKFVKFSDTPTFTLQRANQYKTIWRLLEEI